MDRLVVGEFARQVYVHDAMYIWIKYSKPVVALFEKFWWYGSGVEVDSGHG